LTIGADGITLDLGGHTLSGVTGYRVINDGHDNVTIRNGTIDSEGGDILLQGVTGNLVRDVYAGGLQLGIRVDNSHDNRFVHNHVHSVVWWLSGSDHNVIAHNLVTEYESVLSVNGDYNRVVDNIVWGGFEGVSLGLAGDHNQVRRNVFLNQSLRVVSLDGANDTDFVDNIIGASGPFRPVGTAIEDSSRNRFIRNTVFAVADGFDLKSGSDNVFRGNDVSGAPVEHAPVIPYVPDGFAIAAGVTGTVLRNNKVRGFDDDGIDVDATGTRLRGNDATGNHDLGIEAVPGVVDAGGNTASGNGNPLQCTNVFCS
jgi:parallel beta-helix repeat protein